MAIFRAGKRVGPFDIRVGFPRDRSYDRIDYPANYTRANTDNSFGPNGHPWVSEITEALESFRLLQKGGKDTSDWLESFKSRTLYWCAQVLSGTPPFTPKLRNRLEDESVLIENLPKIIDSN